MSILSASDIARDERPLGQLFWWLMFIAWTPILAAYGNVLDTQSTLATFTEEVQLFEQRGLYHPAIGVLTLAAILQALLIIRLRWHSLWPVVGFVVTSCFIYQFNGPDSSGSLSVAIHLLYALLAAWSAVLFLKHGHLLSPGFGLYVALLVLDIVLDTLGLSGGLLGMVFAGYQPNPLNLALFITLSTLSRMLWLMLRDNLSFMRSLSRDTRRTACKQTLRLWWPMGVIFVFFTLGWLAVSTFWIKPTTIEYLEQTTQATRDELQSWIQSEKKKLPPLRGRQKHWLQRFQQHTHEVTALRHLIANAQAKLHPMLRSATPPAHLQNLIDRLDALRQSYKPARKAPHIARRALVLAIESELKKWQSQTLDVSDPLEANAQKLIEIHILLTRAKTQLALIDASQKTQDVKKLPQKLRLEIDNNIFPASALPRMRVPKCFAITFLDPGCALKAQVARTANSSMQRARQSLIDTLVGEVQAATTRGATSVDQALLRALAESDAQFQTFEANSIRALHQAFQTWRNINLLTLLYSLLILSKTALIVFSRVIFAPQNGAGLAAAFMPDQQPIRSQGLARHGQVLRISTEASEAHYVSRWGVTLEGPPPARRRPLGFRFPLIRVLTGTWAMNRIAGQRSGDKHEFDADLKVDEPAELVSWELQNNEQVAFRFQDFVGMSESLKVRRITSMSLSSLILGRMIYYVAEGPGTLILRTTASARISSDPEAHRPAPMGKLVAWSANTHFGVLAEQTTIDTFLSGYNLKTGNADTVIWDTSTRRGNGPGSGIMRFVKSFVLPI